MRRYSRINLVNEIIIDGIFKDPKPQIHFGNGLNINDKQLLDSKLRDFLTNLDVLIIWRNKYNDTISVNAAIKRLEYMLGKNLSEKFAELSLFMVEYSKAMKEVDSKFIYPRTMEFIHSGYSLRHDAILDLKKDGIKSLRNILEPTT